MADLVSSLTYRLIGDGGQWDMFKEPRESTV